ncbi:Gfo/Idh/MocA family oxidoreductase [Microbacterium capsulatum]|uniref:Gfo/Idh/MocA family oxidoreductase n=1 Tax=Microbacterium capsulatum TaxID=3041921 RepID=A0ABU0XHU2_9MICO|nr:Gfo/Idh/MocA family oxidoreductase [Microbacterium sp. ASV81]MDQ4213705.1 Gfo/Idh/MocA family oxidoreductase [Microbacterium sp. ASV81]
MSGGTIGVALVGAGAMGMVHAAIASGIDELDVVAIVDPVSEATAHVATRLEKAGFRRPGEYATLEEALASPEVDLVVITTPSGLHVTQATMALDAHRHVILEKPLDVDLGRARAMAERAAEAAREGLVATVVSQHRFDAATVIVADALKSNAFGRVTSAIASTAWWRPQSYYESAGWRGTWALDGGGALMNQGVHNVDLLLSFLGRPVEVSGQMALLAHSRIEVEDSVVAAIRFESGAVASVHATTAAYPGLATRLHLMGSLGSAIIEDDLLTYFHVAQSPGIDIGPMGLTSAEGNTARRVLAEMGERTYRLGFDLPPAPAGQYSLDPMSHHLQYMDVVNAITTGTQPAVTVQHAYDAMTAIRSIYVASTLHKPVRFADVAAGVYDDLPLSATDGSDSSPTAIR